MDESGPLQELLMAIFSTDEELRRFLVLENLLAEHPLRSAQKVQTRSGTVRQTVRSLLDGDLVDERLFEVLITHAPERTDDIRSVAEKYLSIGATIGRAATATTQMSSTAAALPVAPPGYAEFGAKLLGGLGSLTDRADPVDPDGDHWPWMATAAVLGSFMPGALQPLPAEPSSRLSAMTALIGCIFTSFDGSWVLEDGIRARCLRRLGKVGRLGDALEANPGIVDSRRDLLRWLLEGRPTGLAGMTLSQLHDLDAVVGWLAHAGVPAPVAQSAIETALERRALIDPLRSLVGKHFRGRTAELATLGRCLDGSSSEQVLVITGPGGAGKSTLLGKVLLDLEDRGWAEPIPFAYIDFDRARNNPRHSTELLGQIAHQLRLQYAACAEQASQFAAVEAVLAGTDLDKAAELLDIVGDLDLDTLISVLVDRLMTLHSAHPRVGSPPLVLILDTTEEVLTKGPGAVTELVSLTNRLLAAIPGIRLITAGRYVIPELGAALPKIRLTLGDLDAEAADALLAALGIGDRVLRSTVIDRFGGNPLTLRLAGQALRRTGANSGDVRSVVEMTRDLAEVSLEQVQGMLYARILGHIRDREVAAVAHPGLAVRRVTVPVLREVLAQPCGFDPAIAEDLFRRLRAEVSMFELEDAHTLRHRQDVRRLMLRTMRDAPGRAAVVAQIHHRAADFYASGTEPAAKAEELYHRLMGGEDPRTLDRLWRPELAGMLEDALEEPLSAPARRWLTRRLRFDSTIEDRAEWDQADWEAQTASTAQSWLATGATRQALTALQERTARQPGSRLFQLEVEALLQDDRVAAAADVLERGMRDAIDSGDRATQLDLSEQAVALRTRQQDWAGVEHAVHCTLALTDVGGDRFRGLRVLTDAIFALRLPDPCRAAAMGDELSSRFAHMSRSDMRADPELTRRVVHAAPTASVLVHAASEVGDRAGEADGVFRDDVFALTRLLERTDGGASSALVALARDVGLAQTDWTSRQVARRAVHTGRTGAAIQVGLDDAADLAASCALVVEELAQPIRPQPGAG